jgi:hypothetical protein
LQMRRASDCLGVHAIGHKTHHGGGISQVRHELAARSQGPGGSVYPEAP